MPRLTMADVDLSTSRREDERCSNPMERVGCMVNAGSMFRNSGDVDIGSIDLFLWMSMGVSRRRSDDDWKEEMQVHFSYLNVNNEGVEDRPIKQRREVDSVIPESAIVRL